MLLAHGRRPMHLTNPLGNTYAESIYCGMGRKRRVTLISIRFERVASTNVNRVDGCGLLKRVWAGYDPLG